MVSRFLILVTLVVIIILSTALGFVLALASRRVQGIAAVTEDRAFRPKLGTIFFITWAVLAFLKSISVIWAIDENLAGFSRRVE